ncbi:MAG TPA: T9SS type A sorting domain-containing protein [Bacteroidia bacterium]|nr:T9SS type A sorting domain-containing protein [Bacteroidia bacterium]
MKNGILILIFSYLFFSTTVKAQIEKVIVETYYVSDSLDATDTIDGSARSLPIGSKTYRVYIDLKKGYKLAKIFGSAAHALKFTSTDTFFNNIDRPTFYYGYLMKNVYFRPNPTLALDSWLTLGLATTTYNGIIKTQDTGVSIINPNHTNNWGGTAAVTGGLLVNNDPAAGIPITNKDGLWLNTYTYTNGFIDNGFKDATQGNIDTTVFGSKNKGSQFISYNCFLQQNPGVMGAIPDSNQILVAQLTTKGTLTFELNVVLIDSAGNSTIYVAKNPNGDTLLNPFLSYPPPCGCRDTRYLEYNPYAACDDSAACKTIKVFGCTDTMACNYDPNANVYLPNFCCYPGYCNDRNVALVCPDLSPYRLKQNNISADIYPNPVQNSLSLQLVSSIDYPEVTYTIYDAYDRVVVEKYLGFIHGNSLLQTDVTDLPSGLYLFRVSVAGVSSIKKFIKN